ncbi:ROK family protein [Paenibacillus sp. 19GGS1-52]|uniref:ROK family transcriptional regulator n=1 Tax=Paenibacillus sp. 19GGS1-52 TaxID=2758563 RepID=UPI001EFB761B|nr:ROK family protein [Paenibacillus sp. 19GGS1-52]ULO09995.1 ROK family protein [Paenibacillus sp. 19GGS1-52]
MENIGGNALVTREVNINLVRRVLKEKQQATKREIAETTGLSVVTVATVLQHLVKYNEVLESGLISSSGGRPAQQYTYNEEFVLALIVYPYETEGCTFIHGTIVNLSGKSMYETNVQVELVNLQSFEQIIDHCISLYASIQALGFGLPGAEYDGKMIVSDYESLLGISVTGHFRTRYQKPVVMENDVNAAVIGFCRRTQVAVDASIVYLYFPEKFPPGAGIYLNGKLYRGRRSFAGEIANIPLGIAWGEAALLDSSELLSEAIAKLTVTICSVLNPDAVVLYGSFLTMDHIHELTQRCSTQLPASAMPKLLLSEDFAADYREGMIVQTLSTLEPEIHLIKYDSIGGNR